MKVHFNRTFTYRYYKGMVIKDIVLDVHEVVYILAGEGTYTINGKKHSFYANTLCYIKPGDCKSVLCTKKADYIAIRFRGNQSLDEINHGVFNCAGTDIFELFTKIKTEENTKKPFYYNVCNMALNEIIYKLARMNPISPKDQAFLDLLRSIDNKPEQARTIQEMADQVSYSYDRFRHKFKEFTGQSPNKYIISRRVQQACYLLQHTDHTCTTIAEQCGFSNSPQFSVLFKQTVGVSPSDYKKAMEIVG